MPDVPFCGVSQLHDAAEHPHSVVEGGPNLVVARAVPPQPLSHVLGTNIRAATRAQLLSA
jgi:hypothetical protein